MKKKKKEQFVDDGRTIYNMDVDGMPGRLPKKNEGVGISKEEKNAAVKGAFAHYLPIVFGLIVCFLLAMLLIYFWLN